MSRQQKTVAIWDIGKTNVKLCVLDPRDCTVLDETSKGFDPLPGPPYQHIDAGGIWQWFMERISLLATRHEIGSIVVTAHGATAALVDEHGLVMPILDYEDDGPEETEKEYAKVRPPFSETLSAPLPGSINFGRGLFWLSQKHPAEFSKALHALSYVQYWSWRLSGVAATECTTMGSHSDLWRPEGKSFSSLVEKLGWKKLFPAMRRADEILGFVKESFAKETGLPADCAVYCGIHDSNASLLPWLVSKKPPFTVSSTGTWVINLSVGASTTGLDPKRDCTTNVSMYGDPVPTSRWMGGREYANITGCSTKSANANDLKKALSDPALMLLPNQGGQAGPFSCCGNAPNKTLDNAPECLRLASATLYCALMLDITLDLCSKDAEVVIDGAFAKNDLLLRTVATLRQGKKLHACKAATGTIFGAARLVNPSLPAPPTYTVPPLDGFGELVDYKANWLEQAGQQ